MGYKHNYNFVAVYREIQAAARTINDSRTDGFISWGVKQDLYQLKWFLDEVLTNAPAFGPEPEWLKVQEQKKIIKYLKDDQ